MLCKVSCYKTLYQKKKSMKHWIVLLTLLVVTDNLAAQEKKWEHQLFLSAGLSFHHKGDHRSNGFTDKIAYGLSYHLNERWALMPGIAVCEVAEHAFRNAHMGADDDHLVFLNLPIIMQLNVERDNDRCTLGLGPVFSFCIGNEHYYVDADPDSPLNHLNKFKTFTIGLQPMITYWLNRHWSLGAEGYIGLMNIRDTHGIASGSNHIHSLSATLGYRF